MLYGTAGYLLSVYEPLFDLPNSFWIQARYSIPLLFLVSLIMIFNFKAVTGLVLIGFSAFISYVVGYPLDKHIVVELILYLPLIIMSLILLKKPYNIISAGLLLLFALLLQKESLAWGRRIERSDLSQLVILFSGMAVVGLALYKMSDSIRRHGEKDDEIRRLEQIIKRLTMANLGFQDYTRIMEEQTRTNERNRITRELHDVVGYTLTNIAMMMEAGIDLYKQNNVKALLTMIVETRDHARKGHSEIRDTLRRLRTIEAFDTQFSKTVDGMIKIFKVATKLDIEVEYTNFPFTVEHNIGMCIIRLIQEGMTNAIRHGRASKAKILLQSDNGELVLSVADNGDGCAKIQEGLGITGMRERLKNVEGNIKFDSSPQGFQFVARIPVGTAG